MLGCMQLGARLDPDRQPLLHGIRQCSSFIAAHWPRSCFDAWQLPCYFMSAVVVQWLCWQLVVLAAGRHSGMDLHAAGLICCG